MSLCHTYLVTDEAMGEIALPVLTEWIYQSLSLLSEWQTVRAGLEPLCPLVGSRTQAGCFECLCRDIQAPFLLRELFVALCLSVIFCGPLHYGFLKAVM